MPSAFLTIASWIGRIAKVVGCTWRFRCGVEDQQEWESWDGHRVEGTPLSATAAGVADKVTRTVALVLREPGSPTGMDAGRACG